MLRAVFFDAGGTLIHVDYALVAELLRRLTGRSPAVEAFVEAEYGGRAAVEAALSADGRSTDAGRWGVYLRGLLGALGYSDAEADRIVPEVRAFSRQRNLWSVAQPGAAEWLERLRGAGIVVGCVSNADGTVDRILDAAGLLPHLDFVVDSTVVGVEKPDPRIFALALERAGARPEEALHVGDVYLIDVRGARRAGMEAVLVDPLGRYRDRGCRTTPDVPALCASLVAELERG